MKKKEIMIGAVFVAGIIGIIIFIQSSGIGGNTINAPNVSKSDAEDIITDKYPDIGDPVFEESCIICDGDECYEINESCWKTNAKVNQTMVPVSISSVQTRYISNSLIASAYSSASNG